MFRLSAITHTRENDFAYQILFWFQFSGTPEQGNVNYDWVGKMAEIWLNPMTKAPTLPEKKIRNATRQHKNATKNFDYTTIADRLRTVKILNVSYRKFYYFQKRCIHKKCFVSYFIISFITSQTYLHLAFGTLRQTKTWHRSTWHSDLPYGQIPVISTFVARFYRLYS